MGDIFGKLYSVTTFGESHGKTIGLVVSGVPAGIKLSEKDIQIELNRRRPGQSSLTTSRKEADKVEILSGVFEGLTTGTALAMEVKNQDIKSSSYESIRNLYRPSHADFSYHAKYGHRDWRGGGRASARETIARVCAGAIAQKILNEYYQIKVHSWVSQVHNITMPDGNMIWDRMQIDSQAVRCPDPVYAKKMEARIKEIKQQGDSIGGVISCRLNNVPAGLGEPVFDKMEADLAKAMLSIPAAKGFDIGSGFAGTFLTGSKHNDIFIPKKRPETEKQIGTKTNNSGGIQGGITNGEDIFFRVAFKPIATIFQEQETVDESGRKVKFRAKGRHDPCVLPRAVPIVDAMSAMVLFDHLLRYEAYSRFHAKVAKVRK